MSKVALLQLPTLSLSPARIDYYISTVKKSGANLAVLGEYVLNSFFSELTKMQSALINEQILDKKELMAQLAKKYEISIIAPFITQKESKFYKVMAKFSPNGSEFVEQNFLINYDHWNEKAFFANKSKNINFLVFNLDGFKFGVMAGFEAHFDASWEHMRKLGVEVVLVPTASTFESAKRWESLLSMRAFTNLSYVLRTNRIGSAKFESEIWEFYGSSLAISPNGAVSSRLEKDEGVLLFELSKDELKSERERWKFLEILKNFKL